MDRTFSALDDAIKAAKTAGEDTGGMVWAYKFGRHFWARPTFPEGAELFGFAHGKDWSWA